MKKALRFLSGLAIAISFSIGMTGCYNDDDLWDKVDDLDTRLTALEQAVTAANTNIATLRQLVDALQQNVHVTGVTQTADGYKITFSNGTEAEIRNGIDGVDAPSISVKQHSDGNFYWTLDGEFMTDADGNMVRAAANDGKDAIAPQVRIDDQSKIWEISTDGGITWTSTGIPAQGKDGDSIFSSVDNTHTDYVEFILADGSVIQIPKNSTLSIVITGPEGRIPYGSSAEYTLQLNGVDKITFTKPDGWRIAIDGTKMTVTAPVEQNTYAETEGTITLIGLSGNLSTMTELDVKAIHRVTLTFEGDIWDALSIHNFSPGTTSTTELMGQTYEWTDEQTQLTTAIPDGFMGGWGYPWFISSYNANSLDQDSYGYYTYDLYVYNPDITGEATTGGGNNGSDNFLTTFGYLDLVYPYGDGRPIFKFADGKARTVESLYVNSTCYFYSVAVSGNPLSPALSEDVIYYATGFDAAGNEVGTVTLTFATTDYVPDRWIKWDNLSDLGPIVELRLNQGGGADNGYGYSLPAYYAVDDITISW